MKDEIKEILDFLKDKRGYYKTLPQDKTDKLLDCITNLQEDVEDLRRIFGVWNNRKLIKKFNKEYDKEDKTKNPNRDYVVIYPDAEEVYKRYYALKKENERLKEQCKKWKENHKAVCIQRDDILDNIVEDIENKINYKSRNEKAIDLIKEAGCYDEETKTFCDDIWEELPELLNILNGGDE